MSYLVIDDFKLGMDRRKARISGTPGALWDGINGHITRGGDFERRKKFVAKYNLPAGTFGLTQVQKQLYVFGSGTTPAGIPAGVNYQRLQHTGSANMTSIIDVTSFGGNIYAVASFDNGDIYHYYNGNRVTTWDTVAAAIASNASIALALATKLSLDPRYNASAVGSVITIQAARAGTGFSISSSAVNHGATNDQTLTLNTVQANVPAVAETRAQYSFSFISGTTYPVFPGSLVNPFVLILLNGNFLTTQHDEWAGDAATTAARCAQLINITGSNSTIPGVAGVSATSSGPTVTIKAPPGYGTTANSWNAQAYTFDNIIIQGQDGTFYGGNGNLNFATLGLLSGGVNAIPAVAQVVTATVGGTFEGADVFTLTVDSVPYVTTGLASGMGITAMTYQGKVYSVTTSLLEFSALSDPTSFGTGTGSGFINMTNQNEDNDALVGIKQYQNRIAVFSRDNIQIWVIAVDPSQNTFQQSIENSGALSVRSILQFGNIDVFYLNDTGVRSIRARDASNAPAVNDVGVAIDPFIQEYAATLTGAQISRACATIDPLDGRYWLAMHNRIFVYSYFPGSKISAWTYYDLIDEIGDTDITEMVKAGPRTFLRSADTIFLYGGDSNGVYPDDDECLATIALPFLSASKPATIKGIKSFDVGLDGVWDAQLLVDPKDPSITVDIGIFDKPTFSLQDNPVQMPCALFSIAMTCRKAGKASVTNMVVHFDIEGEA